MHVVLALQLGGILATAGGGFLRYSWGGGGGKHVVFALQLGVGEVCSSCATAGGMYVVLGGGGGGGESM